MKKRTLILIALGMGLFSLGFRSSKTANANAVKNFYDFKTSTLEGEEFDFSDLKGKKVLIVNTASKCGFTYQYKELEELYNTYKDDNFTIIGFPANNFGFQEPGSDEKIADFCERNYGVSFPMMSKSDVKGKNINALYAWLTKKEHNGKQDAKVSWNFNKFLVNEKGEWVAHFGSKTSPLDSAITSLIKAK